MGSRIAQGVPLALPDTERPAALRTAVHEIERRWGLHAAGRLFGVSPPEAGFSTGSEALDRATGFEGIPRGRLSELTGPPGGGALTLGWRVLGAALDGGGLAAYVDLPGTFAPTAGVAMDLDLSRLVVVRPPDAEMALHASATLLRSQAFEAVLLDLESARPRGNRWSQLADLAGRGAASLIAVTTTGNQRVAGLPYLASLRLGVACRGWRWQRSRLTQVPMGLTLEVRVLKSRSDTGVQHLVIDCPFLRRSDGPQDVVPVDSALSDHGGGADAAVVVGAAAGDLREAS
ncbi:MAG: hypothetical protein OXG65_10730 [Chloroflexi bacterium]|nr:hypothetical protein [Chloroflexota bacterium]